MKKKIIFAALVASFVLAITGCGKAPVSGTPTGSPTPAITGSQEITPVAATTSKGLTELGLYKGIEVEKIALNVTDEDVLMNFYSGLEAAAEAKTDVAAKLYDFANIDFAGYIDGVAFEGGSTNPEDGGANVILGSGSFVPGFEEGIIGMKPGEKKTITVTFPENYKADLAGKEAQFEITLNSLKVLPEITDEIVAANTSFETVDAYKAGIRSDLEERAAATIQSQFESDVYDKLIENCKYDTEVLQPIFDSYQQDMLDNYTLTATQYGIDLEYYVYLAFGITLEDFYKELPVVAEYNIKLEKAFIAIAEAEKITITDAEYDEYIQGVLPQTGLTSREDFEKYYTPEYIKEGMMIEKAQKLVIDSAIGK